ncbi:hypothetical protein [Desulfobacula sp.]|uniref:Uncharacterized protein n=1 Tax=Candidatus Desulfatibia vada TaxID=2841696 RepID=A0A8J6P5B6_9BACT|nr:hypothetical protein [Candidatus Desulfatibia vada]MBL6995788.1 hypothetical protein [Desulfobacula sp.]
MPKIIDYIADKTGGVNYGTYKYSFEGVEVPSIVYDDNQEIAISRKQIGETDRGLKEPKSLVDKANTIKKQDEPLFKYFLDGSRRTYKVDDIAYNDRIYPIVAGQIGVGCCARKSPPHFEKVSLLKQNVLVLPDCADKDGREDYFYNNLRKKINDIDIVKKRGIKIDKILSYPDKALNEGEKYEHKGIAKIQDEMIEKEKELVIQLVEQGKLNFNDYLLKDGSLEYKDVKKYSDRELSKIKSNYRCVVGVSKIFNPELCKDKNKKNIAKRIAELPLYHRTPAFRYTNERATNVEFSIWYLRIRHIQKTIGPFDGILKVEKILVSEDEQKNGLASGEIDLISANLINERCPTCYGHDSRWANHLYPVYLTERFIKSNYLSEPLFLNLF